MYGPLEGTLDIHARPQEVLAAAYDSCDVFLGRVAHLN
jgi:hypothetical protein